MRCKAVSTETDLAGCVVGEVAGPRRRAGTAHTDYLLDLRMSIVARMDLEEPAYEPYY